MKMEKLPQLGGEHVKKNNVFALYCCYHVILHQCNGGTINSRCSGYKGIKGKRPQKNWRKRKPELRELRNM